jgi:Fe2+ transport system protein FeoA
MSLNKGESMIAAHERVPLGHLKAGQTALIEDLLGNPGQVHRLEEMGLRRGAKVEVVQTGTPCILRLGGHKLCFRTDELTSVLVRRAAG